MPISFAYTSIWPDCPVGAERQRLRTRMERLRKQNEFGRPTDTEYRRLRSEAGRTNSESPNPGRRSRARW